MDANCDIIPAAISSYFMVDNIVHAPLAGKCLTQDFWFDRYKHEVASMMNFKMADVTGGGGGRKPNLLVRLVLSSEVMHRRVY